MEDKYKKIIIVMTGCYLLGVGFGFALCHIYENQPQEQDIKYYLNSQYIGDLAGYEDILIMQVFRVDGNNNIYGDQITLYFKEDRELMQDLKQGDIIKAHWLIYPDGSGHINGIEAV